MGALPWDAQEATQHSCVSSQLLAAVGMHAGLMLDYLDVVNLT